MLLICGYERNNSFSFFINVSAIIITFFYWFFWLNKLSYINCSCSCLFFYAVSKILKLISQIFWVNDRILKILQFFLRFFVFFLNQLFIVGSFFLLLPLFFILLFFYTLFRFFFFSDLAWDLMSIQKPFSKIVHWILRLLFIQSSHSFSYHNSNSFWFQIVSIRL